MSKIFISWWEQVKKNRKTLLEKHSERMLKDEKKATFISVISEVVNDGAFVHSCQLCKLALKIHKIMGRQNSHSLDKQLKHCSRVTYFSLQF